MLCGDAFPLKQSPLCSAQGFLLNETTEYFNFQFVRENYSLLVTGLGEGNGHPVQYSCLENPMDRGAWWATVHGVARIQT